MEMDSYNPATYINLGCCEMLFKGDLERAKYFFEQALKIDSTQFEGIYNLGEFYLQFLVFSVCTGSFRLENMK